MAFAAEHLEKRPEAFGAELLAFLADKPIAEAALSENALSAFRARSVACAVASSSFFIGLCFFSMNDARATARLKNSESNMTSRISQSESISDN